MSVANLNDANLRGAKVLFIASIYITILKAHNLGWRWRLPIRYTPRIGRTSPHRLKVPQDGVAKSANYSASVPVKILPNLPAPNGWNVLYKLIIGIETHQIILVRILQRFVPRATFYTIEVVNPIFRPVSCRCGESVSLAMLQPVINYFYLKFDLT